MRVRIARHPLKGGISNRNSGPTVGEVTQTALSQEKSNRRRVPNAVLALALATMDQIEDNEEGIVAAVDYRFVKFYSSRFSVCLRRREILQQ